ncbi:TlpA family protein disulfide reductase [Lentibacillus salinarum]|uniref:TlpA family protein disulfide reductase n=1 Tax=Lentibacillus salinarum TaxID=446820 RepID=A0ABW3ZTM7_9BACI
MKLRDPLPDLNGAARWLNSKSLTKNDLIGKYPVLIHFWSISCDTCKQAMPIVNELRDTFQGQLRVIAVHMPRSEADEDVYEVRRSAKKHHMTQPIAVDHAHTITNAFHNRYVPAYYLFDANGKLRHRQTGSSGLQMLQKRIDRVIAETK